jgi:uncharacterized protein (TIGR01777 family)
MKTVMITGGTGMVGKSLSKMLLDKGYAVIILSRSKRNESGNSRLNYAHWDVNKSVVDTDALQKADFIVHLAGAPVVDKPWTKAYKEEILNSRTKSISLLTDNLSRISHKVKAIVSSSAIGWYGPDTRPGHRFTETDPPHHDFLGETCRLWEESVTKAESLGIRVCKLRTGIVLSNEGGALPEFKTPLRFGVAGILGSGKQIISWIHIRDLCRQFIFAIENETMSGSYNAVAPQSGKQPGVYHYTGKKKQSIFLYSFECSCFCIKDHDGRTQHRSAEKHYGKL